MTQDLKIKQNVYVAINGAITEGRITEIIWNGNEYLYKVFTPCHLPFIQRIWHKRKYGDYDKCFIETRDRVFSNQKELIEYLNKYHNWFK